MRSAVRLRRFAAAALPALATNGSTRVRIDGESSSLGELAVGDYFTAVYSGTPDQSLATVTTSPALSVSAFAPASASEKALYAFVGTVASVDAASATISVNVTRSIPNGLFSGTDTYDVGSQTIVLGNSGNSLFGTLSRASTGDVVAGGVLAAAGESAATVESSPLGVLVDFPQTSSSSSSSAGAETASITRAQRRALKLLRREQAESGHHQKK